MTTIRAIELVEDALATEQDYFTMDDLLGDFDVTDFADARIRCEQASDDINFYGYDSAERKGMTDGRPSGLPEAMTADFDQALRTLAGTVVDRHRAIGSEAVTVLDLHQKYATSADTLPLWDISNPMTANVVRGLVAGLPQVLYPLRGRFSPRDLLTMIWSQHDITTHCGLRVSADCDIKAAPPSTADRMQKVWGVFTVPMGEYLVYFTTCASCYHSLWHVDGEHTDFVTFDPASESPIG